MPHPIYGPPTHHLEQVNLRLILPTRKTAWTTAVEIDGTSSTRRAPIWHYSETWDQEQQERGLQPVDVARHVLLAAIQDRPMDQDQLGVSLRGGLPEQPQFPF